MALANGRPIRIHSDNCDVPMPVVEDVLADLESLSRHARAKFIPDKVQELTEMWLRLVQISDALGEVLRLHNRVQGMKPNAADIDRLSGRLQLLTPNNAMTDLWDDSLRIHAYQTELFYQFVQSDPNLLTRCY